MMKQISPVSSLKDIIRNFAFRKPPESHLQILLYHRILNSDEGDFLSNLGMVHTSTKNFEDHLNWFKCHDYNVMSFNQVSENLTDGQPIPQKSIIITFDDGSLDQYRNAVPLLKKYGYSATFFPIKNCVYKNQVFWLTEFYVYLHELGFKRVNDILQDLPRLPDSLVVDERIPRFSRVKRDIAFEFKYFLSPKEKEAGLEKLRKESTKTRSEITTFCERYMNPDQLKDLIQDGFEIGSHGVHHYPMICLTNDEKKEEIEKKWIDELDPDRRKIFSLPFGSHSLSDLALFDGYDFVLTTKHETYPSVPFGHDLGRFAVLDESARRLSKRLIL
jgi:peptidoglycan/xylan/chitin deacetylase (PgdA/CDA1 family)